MTFNNQAQQKSLEAKVVSLEDEIKRLTAKSAEQQQLLEQERLSYAQDKKALEDTIVDITNAEASSRTDQATRENDLREQMERMKVSPFLIAKG